jgi:hypothetical protein
VVVVRPGVRLRCGRAEQTLVPLHGDTRAAIALPDGCAGKLRATGKGKAQRRALLLRSDPHRDVVAQVSGDTLRVRVRGSRSRALRASLAGPGSSTLELDESGAATLPADAAGRTLRVRVRGGAARLSGAVVIPPG